jgi:hypothetical protein
MDLASETTQQELMTVQNTQATRREMRRSCQGAEVGRLKRSHGPQRTTRGESLEKLQSQTQDWEESTELRRQWQRRHAERHCWFKICKI